MALSMSSAAAATGGGGALSTAAMAHHQPAVITRIQAPKPPPGTHHHNPQGPSMALGADVMDKRLTRLARSTRHLPLVCVDLAGGGHIAYHAPIEGDYASNRGVCTVNEAIGANLVVPINDDKVYKAVRRYLTKGVGYEALLPLLVVPSAERPIDNDKQKQQQQQAQDLTNSAEAVVMISKPHSLLGARRIVELHPSVRASYQLPPSSTSTATTSRISSTTSTSTAVAIDSVTTTDSAVPTLHDQALDGSQPKGDTYDRICFHVPLHANKKQLTMLPDEAVDLLLHQAKVASCKDILQHLPPKQRRAGTSAAATTSTSSSPHPLLQEENFTSVPLAVAVPGYATHDAALESWMELISKDDIECATALLFPRSAAAIMASLLTPTNSNQKLPPPLLQRTKEECQKLIKESQRLMLDMEQGSHLDPLIVTVGVSSQEGYEITALQLSKSLENYPFFEEYRYHHSRCALFPHSALPDDHDKHRILSTELMALFQDLAVALPGRKPCAILVYSDCLDYTHKLEGLVRQTWNEQSTMDSQATTPPTPLIVSCKENAIAFGTVLLAAAKCDRLDSRPVQITSVSHTSVGLRISYAHNDQKSSSSNNNKKEDNVKVIFDFDRRLPAGPYVLEFTATECAAKREGLDASDLQKLEGKKGIPKREEAALNFSIQVVQRQDRFSDWVPVDDIIYPLRMEEYDTTKDDQAKKEHSNLVACESARFEIRMKAEGTLISSLANDGVSVVQAEKSARSSLLQYYGGWIFFILFFGGFLVKSYWDDYVLRRDTKRVLAYYKRAIPNSFNDGDENNARYLVFKYRNKKDKFWARLEKKYGYPIPPDWDLFIQEVQDEEDAKNGKGNPLNNTDNKQKDNDDDSNLDLDDDDTPKSKPESNTDEEL